MKNNHFQKFLMIEHDGSQAIESIMLVPLMLATFFILLSFFFMSLTFILYNNVANSIAQDLNMRQTGYQKAIDDHKIPNPEYLDASKIEISPETPALKYGSYFAISRYEKQFTIPFSKITKIEIISNKSINPSDGVHMSGALITVKIHYNSKILGNNNIGTIPITAIGYGLIS